MSMNCLNRCFETWFDITIIYQQGSPIFRYFPLVGSRLMSQGINWSLETMVDRVKCKGRRAGGCLDVPIISLYSQTLTRLALYQTLKFLCLDQFLQDKGAHLLLVSDECIIPIAGSILQRSERSPTRW